MIYFLDTSALVKRYLPEPGSDQVRSLFRRRRRIAVSRIAYAELLAAVSRACREGAVTEAARDSVFAAVKRDFAVLHVTEVKRSLIEKTALLVLRHPLRAYDAVQLASALTWQERGAAVDFWGADGVLVDAARREHLRATLVRGT